MIDGVINQLRASDSPRLNAIADWAASKDRIKLKALALVYADAQDERLRRLAAAADTAVQRDQHVPTTLLGDDLSQLNNAVSAALLGDRQRAVDALNKALTANPTWQIQPVIVDFAARLLDVPPDKAVALLTAPTSEQAFSIAKGAEWWDEQEIAARNITPRTAIRNWLLYGVVASAATAMLLWIAGRWEMLVYPNLSGELPTTAPPPLRSPTMMIGYCLTMMLPAGVVLMLDVLVRSFILHIGASLAAEARRPFVFFFFRSISFHAIFVVVAVVVVGALVFISLNTLAGLPSGANTSGEVQTLLSRLNVAAILLGVTYAVLMTRLLMDTYRLGAVSGCGVLIGSTLVVGLTAVLLNWLIGLLV